ncbi:hypothetical protein BJ138DRAFT_1010496 [Hygrophoropsis aurantiaca]|uniref:Uncharacterized protein n=1 Tax=Hygrophoropsis aurantiaca TaxID=72124 RepID=A0ACB8A819_9AGAM|nr:hypothetical protein BJ138DRAFT_1010496 [Hygrophoropsis aurantiaca]
MPGHPYATGAVYTRYHAPPVSDADHSHKGSDYAGPHPTTLEASFPPNTAASDVSLRHRLPPRAHLPSHPYAAASSSQADEYSPVHERQGSAGRVPSPRILRGGTPVIERDFASNAGASTSYARGTLSSMAKVSKIPGGVEGKASPTMRRTTPYQGPDAGRIPTSSKGKARDYSPLPDNYPRAVTSSPGARRAYAASPSPPAGAESPLERRDIMPQFGHSAHNSSTQLVITALDNNDDLDHFRDLFYKPPPPNAFSGSREDDASQLSKGIPSDVQSTRSTSAFTALVRSLSEELEGSRDHGKSQEGHPDDALSQEYVFLDMSRSYTSSPVPMDPGTPHRLPIHQDDVPIIQPNSAIPEDVESSRASSMLERDPGDNDTFGFPIQASPTEVVSAPPTPPRAPTHLMIQPEPDVSRQDDHLSPAGSDPRSSEVRSSYMTSASEGSRISNLSDFPVPPARPSLTPAHMSILQTYFDATPTPSKQDGDPMESMGLVRPRPPFQRRESHRTTFGGSEDMNIITEVHSAES